MYIHWDIQKEDKWWKKYYISTSSLSNAASVFFVNFPQILSEALLNPSSGVSDSLILCT